MHSLYYGYQSVSPIFAKEAEKCNLHCNRCIYRTSAKTYFRNQCSSVDMSNIFTSSFSRSLTQLVVVWILIQTVGSTLNFHSKYDQTSAKNIGVASRLANLPNISLLAPSGALWLTPPWDHSIPSIPLIAPRCYIHLTLPFFSQKIYILIVSGDIVSKQYYFGFSILT